MSPSRVSVDHSLADSNPEIETPQDFMGALAGLQAGKQAEMTVLRDGQPLVLKAVPGARE